MSGGGCWHDDCKHNNRDSTYRSKQLVFLKEPAAVSDVSFESGTRYLATIDEKFLQMGYRPRVAH
jgi:hypothetical protein